MRRDAQTRLEDEGVRLRDWKPGNHRAVCPKCSHLRTKKKDPCLSVTIKRDGNIVFFCHHCDWSGGMGQNADRLRGKQRSNFRPSKPEKPKPPKRPPRLSLEPLSAAAMELFAARCITRPTLDALRIGQVTRWMPGCEGRVPAIVFPYYVGGRIVNHKYRAIERKSFIQDAGTRRTVYNIDAVIAEPEVVIVEGEMDVLAMHEAGIKTAVSLPDGAAKRGNDKRMAALVDSNLLDDPDTRFVIAGDSDGPGMEMRAMLVKTLGAERCRAVEWPIDPYGHGERCKDAGDCLKIHGPEAVAEAVALAARCIDGHV